MTFPLKTFLMGGCLALGIFLADLSRPPVGAALAVGTMGAVSLSGAWLSQRREPLPGDGDLLPRFRPATTLLIAVGLVAVGFCDLGLRRAVLLTSPLARLDGQTLVLEGRVGSDLQPAGRATAFTLASVGHRGHQLTGKVALRFFGPRPGLHLGDRVRVEGKLKQLDLTDSYDASLFRRGVVARGTASASDILLVRSSSNPVVSFSNHFRRKIDEAAATSLRPPESGVALGLVIGDERRTPDEVREDFRASGLAHLTAVSGANVAIVLAALTVLMQALRFSRRVQIAVGLAAIFVFAVVTRWEPSVMRASVTAALALAAFYFGRLTNPAQALTFAFAALLAFEPNLLWSIGFQLSFAATAGILWLTPLIVRRLEGLPAAVAEVVSVAAAAQAAVFPLIALHFGRISVVALAANLLAFPLVPPATVLGLAAGVAAMASAPLGSALMEMAGVFVSALVWIARTAGRAGFAEVTVTSFNLPQVLVAYLVVAALALLLSGRARWARWPAAVALLLVVIGALLPAHSGLPDRLRVTFFDVGEGDAALVESPGGARLLVDGGPEPEQIARALRRRGVNRLDVVAASHLHADHVVGLIEVLRRFEVGVAVHPGLEAPLLTPLQSARKLEEASRGEAIQLGDMAVEVLAPTHEMRIAAAGSTSAGPAESSALNDSSLVLRVNWGRECVLFTGDLEEAGQQELLDSHADTIACTIMKAPHHGSARLLSTFVQAVDPEWVTVSVGPNEYGHPTQKALSTFVKAGARVLRTDRLDDIVLEMDRSGRVEVTG
ncbi:MAG: DNA internalization-related competence protein ComEC/Rec2 [Actinomycetota bacterium]|nr:DNA internalization-related competence protein ComEC/Rec2 [Actinomycetota bacterium]